MTSLIICIAGGLLYVVIPPDRGLALGAIAELGKYAFAVGLLAFLLGH